MSGVRVPSLAPLENDVKVIPELTETDLKRFWSKVDQCGPDECWEWQAVRLNHGYGKFRIDGGMYLTHRIAYSLLNGQPDQSYVCHCCDNPACCNPKHLFLGDQMANVADMVSKGRQRKAKGRRHGRTILTEDDVLEIRQASAKGASGKELAADYGVSKATISRIILKQNWKHI